MLFQPAPVAERRSPGSDRQSVDLAAKLCDETGARFYPARVKDLSPRGLRVVVPTNFQPAPGAELYLHLATAHGGKGEAVARRTEMRPVRVAWRMALDGSAEGSADGSSDGSVDESAGFMVGIERLDASVGSTGDFSVTAGSLAA